VSNLLKPTNKNQRLTVWQMQQEELQKIYSSKFQDQAIITRSPGRINLIGEHTDYNLGYVLPAAIDKAAYIAMGTRNDRQVQLYAAELNETYTCSLDALHAPVFHWAAYLLGVADELQKQGHTISGFNAVLSSTVPVGAGMSSSAAIECATIFALNHINQLGLSRLDMVKLAQQAENNFVGVKCGIMDMFASMMGQKNQVIQLDCRSLHYQYFPLQLGEYKIVLFDTQVKHSLAGGEYNQRRQQCEEGVRILQQVYPAVKSLRDADSGMIENYLKNNAPQVVYHRCKYIVEENQRLQTGCQLLLQHDINGFGKQMYGSHEGLSKLYEVSCTELDLLAGWAKSEPAIAGARMMGGGFGGCTINLIKESAVEDIYQRFATQYLAATGTALKMYITMPEAGTSLLSA
jgi:galactokinase